MECGAYLAAPSLEYQMETQHNQSGCAVAVTAPAMLPAPSVDYPVALPQTSQSIDCPVEGYSGRATNGPNLWMKFMHRHMEENIVILNEVTNPHTGCDQGGMFILQEEMSSVHLDTAI